MSAPEVAWAVVDAVLVLVLLGGFCVAIAGLLPTKTNQSNLEHRRST